MAGQFFYVDPALAAAAPGDLGTWGAGLDQSVQVVVGDAGFGTVAAALAACDDGDVLCCVGVLEVPTLTRSVDFVGVPGETTLGNAAGRWGVEVEGDVLVRFRRLALAAPAGARAFVRSTAGAKVALLDCTAPATAPIAEADDEGAVVCLGCTGAAPEAGATGAAGSYPPPRVPATAAAPNRDTGKYRTHMTLLAGARYRTEAGDERRVWVEACEFWGQYDPVRSSEGMVARVEVAGSTGMVYTRVGLPATQDMRVRWRGVDLEVVGVEVTDQRTGELMLGVADLTPGGD